MEQVFLKYIHEFFKELVDIHEFNIKCEFNDGQSYAIEYSSDSFIIKIEKYYWEFYITLWKLNDQDRGINLFNLLDYISQTTSHAPESNYFHDEKDIEECYRKQLSYISDVIYNNYNVINDFFKSDDYDHKIADARKYIVNKYPNMFKTL